MFNKKHEHSITPNFLGIGAQRSATTWLYHVLSDHQDIYMPPVKEIHYFDRLDRGQYTTQEKPKGISLYKKSQKRYLNNLIRVLRMTVQLDFSSLFFYKKFLFEDRSDDWYISLFQQDILAGEITPEYVPMSGKTIEHVLDINPDVKIIYMLRNPTRRAWSAFQLEIRTSHNRNSFSTEEFQNFLLTQRQLMHGKYLENIKKWREKIPENHLFVGFFDAIVYQPYRLLNDLASFLGVDKLSEDPTIYGATDVKMPEDCFQAGMDLYLEPLQELSARFGGYFLDWRDGILVSDKKRPSSIIF